MVQMKTAVQVSTQEFVPHTVCALRTLSLIVVLLNKP